MTVVGRVIRCTQCATDIDVVETPKPFIDASRFVCANCLLGSQTSLLDQIEIRQETRNYDPSIAEIGF